MPKRKKLPEMPDYTALPKRTERMLVQKSRPLLTLSQSPLTLAEFKILDAYLSRINSRDPEKRKIRFEKGELEQLLEVEYINRNELMMRLENLFVKVRLPDVENPNKVRLISLFEIAEIEQDEDGYWQVDLACTQSAMKYIFNVENIGYLKYRLKNIVKLSSRYSYILYLYLEDNYQRVNWQISLKQLRGLLNCTASSYDRFKEFNDKVLKRAFREINEKTSLKFEYEPTARVNRKFTKIEFRIVTKRSHDPGGQKVIEASVLPESAETVQYKYWSDVFGGNDILADICKITRYEFTKEEIEYIAAVLQRVPMEERLLLLNEVYTNMYRYAHRVKNRASYLAASLKKAIKKAIKDAEKEKEEALQEEHCSFNIDEWYSWAESYDPEKINFSEE